MIRYRVLPPKHGLSVDSAHQRNPVFTRSRAEEKKPAVAFESLTLETALELATSKMMSGTEMNDFDVLVKAWSDAGGA